MKLSCGAPYDGVLKYNFTYNPFVMHVIGGFELPDDRPRAVVNASLRRTGATP
ncbi:hypothetical protein [Azospirillum himalayense]|uniref:Uncharacterized protein n=1 Tax=Azospirillum himalayense TaxID=654847 RepID=A0ABW0G7R0_9PROT